MNNRKKLILHKRFIASYKKNTIAIFLSFVLTFTLLTSILVLIHTNHRIEAIQQKTLYTPSDCSISDLSKQEILKLKSNDKIKCLAIEQMKPDDYIRNNQTVFVQKGDDVFITMMAKIVEGRMPKEKNEIVAEKWVLLNLGIEPVINQEFTLQNESGKQLKPFKLVGILSDMAANKKYGMISLYTTLDKKEGVTYTAYLEFNEKINYNGTLKKLKSELGISKKQIKKCPAKEDYRELHYTDIKVISVILVIGMVVFYGVYRIALITREKEYGTLRAIGMKRRQLQNMILLELYEIYCVSVPIGIGIGLLLALFIVKISGDNDKVIYLYNKSVHFSPVIPVWLIVICVGIIAILIGLIGYFSGKRIVYKPIIETISGGKSKKSNDLRFFKIGKENSKNSTLFRVGCKYIFSDIKVSSFIILTICLGVTLFTGLAYRTQILKTFRDDTKEMWYLNGQYEMNMKAFNSTFQGVSRKSLEEIKKLQKVKAVKTQSGLPIRVIDEANVKRCDSYYNDLNARIKEFYGYTNVGNDGKNQIYKSTLYGYNKAALKELKKYVISGDYDVDEIKEDEIILSILRLDNKKGDSMPSSYKEGIPLMQYKVGDEIKVKYRADFKTDQEAYEKLTDYDAEYQYKTYKVVAIVSFEYMFDCNRTVYPLLITSDSQIQKIVPDSRFQCIYIDGNESMNLKEQIAMEKQLIRIGSKNKNIATRSIISEIEQNEMFHHKQMIYVYGMALVSFVLVLINLVINIRYRMQIRTKEIGMLRAIGMSVSMTKKMLLFENMIFSIAAIAAAYFLSHPVLRYLYFTSDMMRFGHEFQYNYIAFLTISFIALVICVVLSYRTLDSWQTKRIVENIEK